MNLCTASALLTSRTPVRTARRPLLSLFARR